MVAEVKSAKVVRAIKVCIIIYIVSFILYVMDN